MNERMNRFNYQYLRNGPHLQMQDDFIALTTRHPVDDLLPAPLLAGYLPAVETERRWFDQVRISVRMPELKTLDGQRSECFRGFWLVVRGNRLHLNGTRRPAARRLSIILKSYGRLHTLPLDEKTAKMNDLCNELRKPAPAADVATLGLTEWRDALTDVNRRYREMSQQRTQELADRSQRGELRKARLEVDRQFRTILNYLDTRNHFAPSPLLTAFMDDVNAVTRHYRHTVAQEQGIREAGEREKQTEQGE